MYILNPLCQMSYEMDRLGIGMFLYSAFRLKVVVKACQAMTLSPESYVYYYMYTCVLI